MTIVAHEDPAVTSLGKQFTVPFTAKRHSRTYVDSGLINGIRRQNLSRRNSKIVESEKRIKARERRLQKAA